MSMKSLRAERLEQRQYILSCIRADLYEKGFLEVETPLLLKTACPDVHIESIPTSNGYLATSTEYQIKRLIAEGFERIFTLTKNFRKDEEGRYHSSEFTMLEWGQAGASLASIEEDAVRFITKAFYTLHPGKDTLEFNGHTIRLKEPWQKLTVLEAFERFLGIQNIHDFSLPTLIEGARKANISLDKSILSDPFYITSYLLDLLQPHLGTQVPTFLHEWPAFLTTSAPVRAHTAYTERTELYIGGIEIANGFPFLTDALQQRALFTESLTLRRELGKPEIALDEKYLACLDSGLPPGAGMALGIDRLVLVLTGAKCLKEIQAFSWDEL